jgi:hypothetical protein
MDRAASGRYNDTRIVQFSPDAILLTELARSMCVALDGERGVLCIAIHSNRRFIEGQFAQRGIDIEAARRSGQYLYLHAAETVSKIMIDGNPDVVRFAEVIGAPVDRMASRYPPVSIFGDMVSLMCAYGNPAGALKLEKLWRSFNRVRPVFRYCAYPPNVFRQPEN